MTIAHVISLSRYVALQRDVTNNVLYGKDVFYNHLTVFGCKAFVLVPKDKKSKFLAKTRQCIFNGYDLDEFGCSLYDLIEKKLVRICDIIFTENQKI